MDVVVNVVGREVVVTIGERVSERFFIEENLEEAKKKLAVFNSLRFLDGDFVYLSRMYGGKYSVWSFFQETVFWNELRYFVKYEMVIKFILSHTSPSSAVVIADENLANLLARIPNIRVIFKNNKKYLRKIGRYILKIVGFLLSYLSVFKLIFTRIQYVIYTPDKVSSGNRCDFRMNSLYQYLFNSKIPYLEFFHTNLGIDLLTNFIKRRHLAIYLESLVIGNPKSDFDADKIAWPKIDLHEKFFYASLLQQIDELSIQSECKIDRLKKILKLSNVSTLVALDDMRYTNELLVACKELGIKTYGFQHGQFSKYHVGWMNYGIPKDISVSFDTLFLWNTFWQKILFTYSNKYDEENTAIGGKTSYMFMSVLPKVYKKGTVTILLPFETNISAREVGTFVKKLLDFGFIIYFSLRPDRPYQDQLDEYGLKNSNQIKIVSKIDEQIISEIDAVLGVHSTLLSEMVLYDKPIFQISSDFDLGHTLRDNGISVSLTSDFTREFIIDAIEHHISKKNIVWPNAPKIEETYKKIFAI